MEILSICLLRVPQAVKAPLDHLDFEVKKE
jgi:hypothetical protein